MRVVFSRVLAGAALAVLLVMGNNAGADAAQVTRTLEENTRITPPGVIVAKRSEIPMFKKGTVVTLNEYGEVLEGTLAEDISLPYETGKSEGAARMSYTPPTYMYVPMYVDSGPRYRILPFKGDTRVVFNDRGEVVFGTISGAAQSIMLDYSNHILVADGEISFHKNGMLASCTLNDDSFLRPAGWQQLLNDNFKDNVACPGYVEFKGKKPVKLNEKGEVLFGTLDKDTKLPGYNKFATGVVAKLLYEAGTEVELDGKGVVVKATKK
ncbi:hypothetical protein [Anaeroselena agilis]|uniref:Uncharacterized protein n=1 Tax=Anaeroselena agilis TaxID=3063788 RepID=A0ABU3NV95_9FIRM|nr:hypothetical protein [Selenomonadales bacterium 4137-cl]